MERLRLIIREAVEQFLEAQEDAHYLERIQQRLKSEFSTFVNEKPENKKVVSDAINLLKKINFPLNYDLGISLFKGSYSYRYFEDETTEGHSIGSVIWVVIRGNVLRTIFFSQKLQNPNGIDYKIELPRLEKYLETNKDKLKVNSKGEIDLTEKDIIALTKKQSEIGQTIINKNIRDFKIDGVNWSVDKLNNLMFKKNKSEQKYNAFDFLESIQNEKIKDEILEFLLTP